MNPSKQYRILLLITPGCFKDFNKAIWFRRPATPAVINSDRTTIPACSDEHDLGQLHDSAEGG